MTECERIKLIREKWQCSEAAARRINNLQKAKKLINELPENDSTKPILKLLIEVLNG